MLDGGLDWEQGFKALAATIWAGFIGWNGLLMKGISKVNAKAEAIDKALDEHKLYVSDNYVKNRAFDEVKSTLTEMQKDIKILIGRTSTGRGQHE
jgi:hypothetical protein